MVAKKLQATDTYQKTPEATILGAVNAALIATVNLVGSPWVLDWDGGLVTLVNVVVGAWVLVGAFVLQWVKQMQ